MAIADEAHSASPCTASMAQPRVRGACGFVLAANPEVTLLPMLSMQRHDLSYKLSIFPNRQQPQRDGQLEAPRTAASGIEIQHALLLIESRLMRVPKQHCREPSRGRVEMEGVDVVQHVDITSFDLDNFSLG